MEMISDSLKRFVIDTGLSNYEISKLTGLSQSVLSRWINNQRDITLETAAKIACVIGAELNHTKRPSKT
jgi:plasmid maintenance system antidote protein VapI